MSDFNILRDLIRDDAKVAVEYQYGKKIIILKESGDQQQAEYSLNLRDVPDDIFVFKADAFPPPKSFFKDSKNECKRADFVVIASDNRTNWIVYIEMKSGRNSSKKEIEQQLRGAQCLVAYCRAVGQEFWTDPGFLDKRSYKQRFISIKNVGIQKRPTREKPSSGRHDKPERMLKISAPARGNLRFKNLVGKP